MGTLYDLTDDYLDLLMLAEDPDVDPQILKDTMEAIEGEIEEKADGYAMVIRELSADSDKLKSEIARLKERKDAIDNNIKRMKESLQAAMIATEKRKFKTTLFSFSIRKNPESVVVDVPWKEIPEDFLRYKDPVIDKIKLKKAIQSGIKIDGARLEQSESLIIR